MKPWQKKACTHVICLAVGVGLAVVFKQAVSSRAAEETAPAATTESQAAAVTPQRPGKPMATRDGHTGKDGAVVKSGDYRAAWNAIGTRDLTIQQRLELQIGVLREWAMVDMEGAMRAALENAWDGGTAKGGVQPLMVAFAKAFEARPADAWDLLQSGKLGLGTELFRAQWVSSASRTEPLFVFSVAEQIPYQHRMGAIQNAMRSASADPEMKEQMIRKLADLPNEPGYDNFIAIAFNALPANEGNAADVRGRLAAATNERAKTILLHEFASTLREADPRALGAEWEKLDPEMKKRAAVAFSNGEQGTRNAPAVLDMLMATDQWDRVMSSHSKLSEYGKTTKDPKQLAEWGMTLPERPEAEVIFRQTIDPFINRNNAEAKQWIDSLPAGEARKDRALYAYTQNALYARNDVALYEWALERMTDSAAKTAAQNSYASWLKRRGQSAEK